MVLFLFLNFHVRRISICYDNKYAGFCLTSWRCSPCTMVLPDPCTGMEQISRFWNPDRTVRSDRKNLKPFSFTICLWWRTVPCQKIGTRTNHSLTIRFYEPWPVFKVRTISFCFSFSCEFWPIHWYEIMIRSRRNERAWRRIKIGRRSDNFKSWTKGFVRKKKKKNQRRRRQVPQKKKKRKKKKNTTKQDLCPVEAAASILPTQLPIMPSSSTAASSSFFFFFFFSFFFPLMEITL